jgi:hypothetical protein
LKSRARAIASARLRADSSARSASNGFLTGCPSRGAAGRTLVAIAERVEPLTPPGVEVDSFRYLSPSEARPDAADRLDVWRRVGKAISTGPGASPVMAHTVDDSIYD